MRRVAITGLGIVCALGRDANEFWKSLSTGRSAIAPIASLDTANLRFHNGAEVAGFRADEHFPGGKADFLDRFAQFAVVAARQAIADAGIAITPALARRTAVMLGSCVGGQTTQDAGFQELYKVGRNRVHPLTIPKTMANAGASHICMEFGVTVPAMTISTACSSANHSIGQAFWMVRDGQA